MRQRIFDLVGPARDGDYASRAYDIFIVLIAVISLVPMLFDPTKTTQFESDVLWVLDIVTAYILLFDYILRWMTHDIKTDKGWEAFVIYPFTPMAIIDILAILPTLSLVPQTLRFLRILRVAKVFRYSKNLLVVTNACAREARTLASVFIAVVVYMFVVALVVFNVEPESFNNYFDAVCWACTAMTSVSFSDSRPVGYIGQSLSILSSLVALLVVALPAGVITGAYINEVRESKRVGSRYFTMAGKTKIRLSKLERPSTWLRENRKILRYVLVMAACFAFNCVLSLTLIGIGSPIWLTGLSAAVTAFLLEPAAGVIVAFVSAVTVTFVQGNTTSMLYFFSYAIVALAFGIVFPKASSKRKWLRVFATLAIQVVACGAVDLEIDLLLNNWDVAASCDYMIGAGYTGVILVSKLGLDVFPTIFLGIFLDRLIESIPLLVLFIAIVKLFGVQAAPSEKERKQQQAILLERALAREQIESEELRKVARDTLKRKHEDIVKQQGELEKERELIEKRLEEIDLEMGKS